MLKKRLKQVGKIALILVLSLIGVFALAIGGLNLAKFAIYSEYYSIKSDVCKNPEIGNGFVCQGLAASEENDLYLVCGYMADGSASRIYVTNKKNEVSHVRLQKNGKPFTGHTGGVATTGENVYLADGSKIYTLSLQDILSASEGEFVEVGNGTAVNNAASFVYTDDTYLYVGEFHDGGKYTIEGHENDTAEGMHYAICTKYAIDDLTTPLKVYSIRNKVQGICFTPEGKVVLSTSYGVADTVYYVYNESEATDAGKTMDGAPLYYLDDLVKEMHGPAMGEDLDFSEGKVITLTESASDKYIFGKFFGANKIVGLQF